MIQDMEVTNVDAPRRIIKASKMDQFREWANINLGWTGTVLCPVMALLAYLVEKKRI